MKKTFLLCLLIGLPVICFSQKVYIENKLFKVNGCPIYFNGANTPWDNWNDFGGNYDANFWSTHFATLKTNKINSSRVWISCNGDVQPYINSDGTVTGVSAQFWSNLDNFFQSAQTNGIYIMATMMSFDHTKNTYVKYNSWRNMLNDPNKVQTYIDNYLIPFVNRYKSNPYFMSIDICNEIEWIAEDASNMRCSYAVLQRFVAMCANAIHNNPRTDGSKVLVTLGSAATKWNATKMRNGSYGTGWQNNPDGNKWSDAALKAQYNQTGAILDYYSPHYYSWVDQYYSNPYVKTPLDFGMDEKAVLVGETPGGNPGTPNMDPLTSYEALKANGYQGHFPWTSNGVDSYGGLSNFGTAASTFTNKYPTLIYPMTNTSGCLALPVVFTDFNAVIENGVMLFWTTASEHNNDYFTVLRSTDGKNWTVLAEIKGSGSSPNSHTYTFTDANVPAGNIYYKIRQTDYDGKYADSPIESVVKKTEDFQAFPNPFTSGEALQIYYVSGEDQHGEIIIINTFGQKVFAQKIDLKEGINELKIDLGNLSKGTYLISVFLRQQLSTKILIVD